MQSKSRARLEALEKAANARHKQTGVPQIVIFDLKTQQPLTPPDPTAFKQFWILTDGDRVPQIRR